MLRAPLYQSLGLLLLCSVVIFPTQAADEPDWAREQRLDAQTRDAVFDGEPIDLEADGRSFLAIDMEPDEDPKGGVILMHGRGFQPDWHQVVGPLRVSLAEAGWRTLSIQMPVLEKQAKYYDYVPILKFGSSRINAAIAHMRDQGVDNIILLAHSCSVHMAMHWVNSPTGLGFKPSSALVWERLITSSPWRTRCRSTSWAPPCWMFAAAMILMLSIDSHRDDGQR